jgi:hypothetical protein
MEDTNAKRFFELVRWFNDFSNQIYHLYTKMSILFCKSFKLKEKRRYANFSSVVPYISQIFHMGLASEVGYSIDVMFILDADKITSKQYEPIPSITITKIEGGDGIFYWDSYWEIFSDSNESIEKSNEGYIRGKFKLKDKVVSFSAVQIDLEKFNNKNIDDVLLKEILPMVEVLIKQY